MARKINTYGLSAEQYRIVSEAASKMAIEKYQEEVVKRKKENRDRKLHNTKMLMEHYRDFVAHSEMAISDASQIQDDYSLEELLDLMSMDSNRHSLTVESIKESAVRTRIIVDHIGNMLGYYKFKCESSGREEMMRRCDTLYGLYVDENEKTPQELANQFFVDLSTVYRYNRQALRDVSVLLFGCFD